MPCSFEPDICFSPQPHLIESLPTSFNELSSEELAQDWGKELMIGRIFAREMDLYRALTCFKRALILIPRQAEERRMEIEYEIFLAYYMGNKYEEAIEVFEKSHLMLVSENFPAFRELIITLYDAYTQIGKTERAYRILCLISASDTLTANNLILQSAVIDANFPTMIQIAENYPEPDSIYQFLSDYECQTKSVLKAKTLNAILPGAGYLYVGQKKTALTSFLINALFIACSYQLFERGYIPAAIITTSLEVGWYFGGINGAGLAAKEYNERLYENLGKQFLLQHRLFPVLMIHYGF